MTRWVGPLLGLLAAVVLLAPAPDPGELVRQIVGRSLAKDANDDGPLFRALAERAVDGAFALDAPEGLRGPFDSALNVFNAKRETPLRVAPGAGTRLALSLEG